MERGEQVLPSATAAAAVVSAAAYPTTSPPPLVDPVAGSDLPDHVPEPEIHVLVSDEELDHEDNDHDHDHDHDHVHDHEHDHDHHHEDQERDHAVNVVSLEDLKLKIIKQVEYYFSDENLPNDKYLMGFVKRNKEGFVPISVIASFRKMKKFTRDHAFIVDALKESSLLVVSGDGKRVKRLNPLRFNNESRDHKLYTVLVENLPEDHSKKNIQQIFNKAGNIKRITIHDPHSTSEAAKHNKQEMFISNKLHALVEYETIEAAEKAVAMLNNEQDWRNGMRVKLLKRMGKYGHKKQVWKASNPEKNSSSHVSEQTGDEENHGSNEHHEDVPEEDDGEHLSKDKGGHRYRNQGRSRKHKYRAGNGMGHGTSPSTHAAEVSKPPPGPRMPDGTRGFAMGRGRPPVPAPN